MASGRFAKPLDPNNWEEEIEHIPLLMTKMPEKLDTEKDFAIEALQAIKFEESDPEEGARIHKEDGNEHFKKKDFKKAITAYSEGLKKRSPNDHLNAVLYTNRAACHFNMKNYRSCIMDCNQAVKLDPGYVKMYYRGAAANMELDKYSEAKRWCEQGLQVNPNNPLLMDLQMKASKLLKVAERDARKKEKLRKKEQDEYRSLFKAIKEHGVTLAESEKVVGMATNDPSSLYKLMYQDSPHPCGGNGTVQLLEDGCLVWPVVLLYPEHQQSDYINSFHENASFHEHLSIILSSPPPWDHVGTYQINNVDLYFENSCSNTLKKLPLTATLSVVLSEKEYVVISGTPCFIVLARNSAFTATFLSRYC